MVCRMIEYGRLTLTLTVAERLNSLRPNFARKTAVTRDDVIRRAVGETT